MKSTQLHTPKGVRQWVYDCGFDTLREGGQTLEVPERTWFRWLADGLPKRPAHRQFIVREMRRIQKSRERTIQRRGPER